MAGYLRKQGVLMVIYIDDIIVLGYTREQCQANMNLVLQALQKSGFLVNYKKSQLIPSQCAEVLGFLIDTRSQTIRLTDSKQLSLCSIFSRAITRKSVKIREFAKWIGLCISIFPCMPRGKMFLQGSRTFKIARPSQDRFHWKQNHAGDVTRPCG